jgi:hypothetical protein
MNARTLRAARVAVLVLATAIASCGYKTNPRPPEDTAPVVPGELALAATAEGVRVVWNRAEKNAAGEGLYDLAGFLVERSPAAGDTWITVTRIPVTDNARFRRAEKFSWVDPSAGTGAWLYRVRAFTADQVVGPPTPARAWPEAGD